MNLRQITAKYAYVGAIHYNYRGGPLCTASGSKRIPKFALTREWKHVDCGRCPSRKYLVNKAAKHKREARLQETARRAEGRVFRRKYGNFGEVFLAHNDLIHELNKQKGKHSDSNKT